jgi:hypothetical protein
VVTLCRRGGGRPAGPPPPCQAYTLRSLHILLFGQDLACANVNFCKPHVLPDGSGGVFDACGPKSCCGTGDTLCQCSSAVVDAGGDWELQGPTLDRS